MKAPKKLKRRHERILLIHDSRPDFDRACERAFEQASTSFGIDDNGHSMKNEIKFDRSKDSISIEFLEYAASFGWGEREVIYKFAAWIERVGDYED